MTDTGTCRSCDAPILWVRTVKGHRHPLDVEPAEGGTWRVDNGVMLHVPEAERAPDQTLYTSHFSSCPDADKHRRKK